MGKKDLAKCNLSSEQFGGIPWGHVSDASASYPNWEGPFVAEERDASLTHSQILAQFAKFSVRNSGSQSKNGSYPASMKEIQYTSSTFLYDVCMCCEIQPILEAPEMIGQVSTHHLCSNLLQLRLQKNTCSFWALSLSKPASAAASHILVLLLDRFPNVCHGHAHEGQSPHRDLRLCISPSAPRHVAFAHIHPYLPYPLYVPNIHPLQDWHAKGVPVFDVTTPLRTKITKVFLEDFLLKARHVACGAIHVHSDSSLALESCARNSASGEPMHSGQVCRSKPTKHSCWSCSCCLRAAAAPSRALRVSEKKCWFCQICQTSWCILSHPVPGRQNTMSCPSCSGIASLGAPVHNK